MNTSPDTCAFCEEILEACCCDDAWQSEKDGEPVLVWLEQQEAA